MQAVKGLKVGDVLQSLYFPCMQATIEAPMSVEDCWVWHLARRKRDGGYEKFGHARYSEIDPLSWKLKEVPQP